MSPIQICRLNCLKNSWELARKDARKSAQEGERSHKQRERERERGETKCLALRISLQKQKGSRRRWGIPTKGGSRPGYFMAFNLNLSH